MSGGDRWISKKYSCGCLQAELHVGSSVILWREIIGNGFGLASALLGMFRKVAAWPVGIVGNVLLFTVFVGTAIGGAFDTPQQLDLWGQAGRQVFFIIVSVYGWVRWYQYRKAHAEEGVGVRPKWAGANGRLQLLVGALALTTIFYFVLKALGSWGPLADAWILTGSILATYGMARGWVEFWLIWIAVDLVGVPLLLARWVLPVGDHVHRQWRVLCSWLRGLDTDRKSRRVEGRRLFGL